MTKKARGRSTKLLEGRDLLLEVDDEDEDNHSGILLPSDMEPWPRTFPDMPRRPGAAVARRNVKQLVRSAYKSQGITDRIEAFMAFYDESPMLCQLREKDPQVFDRVLSVLIGFELPESDLILDSVDPGTPEAKELSRKIRKLEEAAEILREDGREKLASSISVAIFSMDLRIRYRRSGKPESPKGRLATALEDVLTRATKLSAPERRKLISALVKDRLEPVTTESIRVLLKDAKYRTKHGYRTARREQWAYRDVADGARIIHQWPIRGVCPVVIRAKT